MQKYTPYENQLSSSTLSFDNSEIKPDPQPLTGEQPSCWLPPNLDAIDSPYFFLNHIQLRVMSAVVHNPAYIAAVADVFARLKTELGEKLKLLRKDTIRSNIEATYTLLSDWLASHIESSRSHNRNQKAAMALEIKRIISHDLQQPNLHGFLTQEPKRQELIVEDLLQQGRTAQKLFAAVGVYNEAEEQTLSAIRDSILYYLSQDQVFMSNLDRHHLQRVSLNLKDLRFTLAYQWSHTPDSPIFQTLREFKQSLDTRNPSYQDRDIEKVYALLHFYLWATIFHAYVLIHDQIPSFSLASINSASQPLLKNFKQLTHDYLGESITDGLHGYQLASLQKSWSDFDTFDEDKQEKFTMAQQHLYQKKPATHKHVEGDEQEQFLKSIQDYLISRIMNSGSDNKQSIQQLTNLIEWSQKTFADEIKYLHAVPLINPKWKCRYDLAKHYPDVFQQITWSEESDPLPELEVSMDELSFKLTQTLGSILIGTDRSLFELEKTTLAQIYFLFFKLFQKSQDVSPGRLLETLKQIFQMIGLHDYLTAAKTHKSQSLLDYSNPIYAVLCSNSQKTAEQLSQFAKQIDLMLIQEKDHGFLTPNPQSIDYLIFPAETRVSKQALSSIKASIAGTLFWKSDSPLPQLKLRPQPYEEAKPRDHGKGDPDSFSPRKET